MHIYFNDQGLNFIELKNKPAKKGYKIYKLPKDYLWRRMNQKLADDKQKNFLRATLE